MINERVPECSLEEEDLLSCSTKRTKGNNSEDKELDNSELVMDDQMTEAEGDGKEKSNEGTDKQDPITETSVELSSNEVPNLSSKPSRDLDKPIER